MQKKIITEIKEYAKENSISVQAVYKQIKNATVETIEYKKKKYILSDFQPIFQPKIVEKIVEVPKEIIIEKEVPKEIIIEKEVPKEIIIEKEVPTSKWCILFIFLVVVFFGTIIVIRKFS